MPWICKKGEKWHEERKRGEREEVEKRLNVSHIVEVNTRRVILHCVHFKFQFTHSFWKPPSRWFRYSTHNSLRHKLEAWEACNTELIIQYATQRWAKYTGPLLESKYRHTWSEITPIQVKVLLYFLTLYHGPHIRFVPGKVTHRAPELQASCWGRNLSPELSHWEGNINVFPWQSIH